MPTPATAAYLAALIEAARIGAWRCGRTNPTSGMRKTTSLEREGADLTAVKPLAFAIAPLAIIPLLVAGFL